MAVPAVVFLEERLGPVVTHPVRQTVPKIFGDFDFLLYVTNESVKVCSGSRGRSNRLFVVFVPVVEIIFIVRVGITLFTSISWLPTSLEHLRIYNDTHISILANHIKPMSNCHIPHISILTNHVTPMSLSHIFHQS